MKRNRMRECMKEYNRMVKKAMEGDVTAQEWLIDCSRGDRKENETQRWDTFMDWKAWNETRGRKNIIKKMMKDI